MRVFQVKRIEIELDPRQQHQAAHHRRGRNQHDRLLGTRHETRQRATRGAAVCAWSARRQGTRRRQQAEQRRQHGDSAPRPGAIGPGRWQCRSRRRPRTGVCPPNGWNGKVLPSSVMSRSIQRASTAAKKWPLQPPGARAPRRVRC